MSASGRPFTQGLPPKTASAVDSPLFIQGLSPEKSPAVDFRLPRHRAGRATRRAAAAAAFASEYVIDYNGAAACRRCGYSARGAKQKAHLLLRTPEVQREIRKLVSERRRRRQRVVERTIAELCRVAFAGGRIRTPYSATAQRRALATLCRHLGIGTPMHVGPVATGADLLERQLLETMRAAIDARLTALPNGDGA